MYINTHTYTHNTYTHTHTCGARKQKSDTRGSWNEGGGKTKAEVNDSEFIGGTVHVTCMMYLQSRYISLSIYLSKRGSRCKGSEVKCLLFAPPPTHHPPPPLARTTQLGEFFFFFHRVVQQQIFSLTHSLSFGWKKWSEVKKRSEKKKVCYRHPYRDLTMSWSDLSFPPSAVPPQSSLVQSYPTIPYLVLLSCHESEITGQSGR